MVHFPLVALDIPTRTLEHVIRERAEEEHEDTEQKKEHQHRDKDSVSHRTQGRTQ